MDYLFFLFLGDKSNASLPPPKFALLYNLYYWRIDLLEYKSE